jgi:hypothetical protein
VKFNEWVDIREQEDSRPNKPTKTNSQGGFDPISNEIPVFKKADLITLPENVEGTNCFNCEYVKKMKDGKTGFCENEAVKQWVNERMCCAYWDNHDVKRLWKK